MSGAGEFSGQEALSSTGLNPACPGVCPPPQRSLCVTPNRAFYCSLSARPFSLKAPVPPPPHPRLVQHAPSTLVLLCVTPRPFISFVFLPQSPSEATSLEPLGGDGEKCPGWRESPGTPPSVPSLLPLSLFADEHDEVQPLRDLGPQQKPQTSFQCPLPRAQENHVVSTLQGAATEVQRPLHAHPQGRRGPGNCLPGSSYPRAWRSGAVFAGECRQCLDVEESETHTPSGPGQMM